MTWVPNLLSLSRIPLTIAAVHYRSAGNGPLAFTLLAMAVFTDMIDGAVARRLHAETILGKKFIDPFSDFFMTTVSGFGLALGPTGSAWPIYVGASLCVTSAVMKRLKHGLHDTSLDPTEVVVSDDNRDASALVIDGYDTSKALVKRFCNAALPLLYLATILSILINYAYDAAIDEWTIWLTTVLGVVCAAWIKRQRLIDWLSGKM